MECCITLIFTPCIENVIYTDGIYFITCYTALFAPAGALPNSPDAPFHAEKDEMIMSCAARS